MFDHFIDTLTSSCKVVELSSDTDYRQAALAQGGAVCGPPESADSAARGAGLQQPLLQPYIYPLGPAADAALDRWWQALTQEHQGQPGQPPGSAAPASGGGAASINVMFGRSLAVPRSARGVAWFTFEALCGRPLGAADYLALAQRYHTLLLSGVPAMSLQKRDQARRFITLIDELYNARRRLVCSAACAPNQLFAGAEGDDVAIIDLEQLQFETAVSGSRLRRNLTQGEQQQPALLFSCSLYLTFCSSAVGATKGIAGRRLTNALAAVAVPALAAAASVAATDGGVAPVLEDQRSREEAMGVLGGMEERFAFRRAVSRLYEMQSVVYASTASHAHHATAAA